MRKHERRQPPALERGLEQQQDADQCGGQAGAGHPPVQISFALYWPITWAWYSSGNATVAEALADVGRDGAGSRPPTSTPISIAA